METVVITLPILQDGSEHSEESLISYMTEAIEYLTTLGALKGQIDSIILDFNINREADRIEVQVPLESVLWANKLTTVGAGMSRFGNMEMFTINDIDWSHMKIHGNEGISTFSMTTINERLRISKLNSRTRFRWIIQDYKKYWNSKKSAMLKDVELMKRFRNIFLTDVMGMFTEIMPFIEEGKQLAVLVGTSQISPDLNKVSRDLSLAYRKALRAEKNSGQINKTLYQNLKKSYSEFMTILMKNLFPEMNVGDANLGPDQIAGQTSESRKYSYTESGRIKLF